MIIIIITLSLAKFQSTLLLTADHPSACFVQLINRGVKIRNGEATVEFESTGAHGGELFNCAVGSDAATLCGYA